MKGKHSFLFLEISKKNALSCYQNFDFSIQTLFNPTYKSYKCFFPSFHEEKCSQTSLQILLLLITNTICHITKANNATKWILNRTSSINDVRTIISRFVQKREHNTSKLQFIDNNYRLLTHDVRFSKYSFSRDWRSNANQKDARR